MSTENMSIWKLVEKTDVRYTKEARVGGQNITSLNGTAMIMKATEVFGPAGIGFGWSVLDERYDKGVEMFYGEGDKRVSLGFELNHTVKISFWFKLNGERGEIEQYGCTPYLYKSKFGTTTDGEAPKKSLTDAIKKALSMLGFSADVFLGLFDDRDYVAQRTEEVAIEAAEDKEAEAERQRQGRLSWLQAAVAELAHAPTEHALKAMHAKYVRDANRRGETAFITRLARAFDERAAALKEKAA